MIFILGSVHLAYTFFTPKLGPRERSLQEQMDKGTLVLTRHTTLWRAWVGFNASHGLGAMFFGAIYVYLAWLQPGLLFSSVFLGSSGIAMLLSYLALAKRYWFEIPFRGIALATVFYVSGFVADWLTSWV